MIFDIFEKGGRSMPDLTKGWTLFATGVLNCPDCGVPVPVPIEAHIDAEQNMHLRPVLIDVHAHTWTHQQPKDEADPR